jgi:putative nucleotidyltransferase with HDIG domain
MLRLAHADGTALQAARLIVFGILVAGIAAAAVLVDFSGRNGQIEPGEIARETYKAPVSMTYVSDIRTAQQRQQAYNSVSNIVETHDESLQATQLGLVEDFLEQAGAIRATAAPDVDRVAELQRLLPALSDVDAESILQLSDSAWQAVEVEARRLTDRTMSEQIQSDRVSEVVADLSNRVSSLLTTRQQSVAVGIVRPHIRANVFIDDEATLAKRQAAADAVQPVEVTVQAGQAIVRDGDVVAAEDVEALETLGLLAARSEWPTRLGQAGMMVILTLALVVYLYAFNREIWQERQLLLVGMVILTPIIAARILLPDEDIQYMFPAAASMMLLTVLLSIQFATVVSTMLALSIGVVAGMSFELVFIYFISGIAGAFVVWRAERTVTFLWAGGAVALAMFASAMCFQLAADQLSWSVVIRVGLEAVVAGALAASITFLTFSVLGSLFGILTHLQLQELAHPRQQLLSRLAREAPGTYHHSIIVSNLAESAAEQVGGDPLFARVAVLYHDIGKIQHPSFFIENQTSVGNIHDTLDPYTSAAIIIDHVTDGIAMGRKARLPKRIVDVIAQHHGASRVEYFYRKALEQDDDVDEQRFRYPGPKPQTKESAIIMLADSVEAAVRAAASNNRLFRSGPDGTNRRLESEQLREFVHSIIQARVDDGQLDQSPLTYTDVHTIEDSFVQILEGIYHPRVEYPMPTQAPLPEAPVSTPLTASD